VTNIPRKNAQPWPGTDVVTNIITSGTPDDVFNALKAHFTDQEISDLTFASITMNALNRLGISMRK
jgi:alkylhydroperoxidase family enzyme